MQEQDKEHEDDVLLWWELLFVNFNFINVKPISILSLYCVHLVKQEPFGTEIVLVELPEPKVWNM